MDGTTQDRATQQEFLFNSPDRKDFLSHPPRPASLGLLPVSVLEVSVRARTWLRAHKIGDLNQLIEAEKGKVISRQCLDNQIRKELYTELRRYWNGKKFKYILALNFLDHGIDKALGRSKVRKTPVKKLTLSPTLQKILQKKRIQTIGQLLLQEELKWRNPRSLGNILVNELLISLSVFLTRIIHEN
ncbi:MAG: hypothetical protein V1789_08620 [PVC group bacterium]